MNAFLWVMAIIGLLAGIIGVILSKAMPDEGEYGNDYKSLKKSLGIQGPIYAIIGVLLLVLTCSFTIIPTGQVGTVYQLGVLQEGIGSISSGTVYWHTPFLQQVKQQSIMQENANEAPNAEDRIWGESKNKLPVYCRDVRITYQINPDGMMYLLKNVVDMSELKTWGKSVASAFAASTINFDDNDVAKQSLIEPVMLKELQRLTDDKYGRTGDERIPESVKPERWLDKDGNDVPAETEGATHILPEVIPEHYGGGRSNVIVVRVLIGELDYEQAYQDAITARKNAEQDAVTAAVENRKKIDAEIASATVETTKAQGESDARRIRADAEAYEYQVKSQEITPELLKKWELDARLKHGWVTITGAGTTIVDTRENQ